MTNYSVKLKDTDDSAYGYPKRYVEFKTRSGSFETPTRAVTNHEYAQKVASRTDITYDPDVSIFVERLNFKKLTEFLTKDKPFENLNSRLKKQVERGQNSKINLALLKLTSQKDKEGNKPQEILQSKKNRDKFLRMIIQWQIHQGLDLITIPYISLPEEDSKKMIKEITEHLEKENKQGMFFLEMNKKFPNMIKYMAIDMELPFIGINYKKYTSAVQSYEAIRDLNRKDLGFITEGVPRDDISNDSLSTLHELPFLGNDIFSSTVPPRNPMQEENINFRESVGKIKFFHKKPLTVNRLIDKEIDVSEILNDVNRTKDEKIREMLTNLSKVSKDNIPERLTRIRSFAKVHEAKSSKSELSEFREFVKRRETKNYLDKANKISLKKAVGKIK